MFALKILIMNKMKLNQFLVLFVLINNLWSCAAQKQPFTIDCANLNNDGCVTFNISNLKNNGSKQASEVLKKVLFLGYSSAECQTQKPILKESEDIENFDKISKNFFSKNGIWKSFAQPLVTNNELIGGNNSYKIIVFRDKLRKYLEDQKIIKSLSNGF